MSKRQLYFAYGSNLNVAAMQRRCPAAKKVGKLILPQAKLVFRHVADVIYDRRDRVPGGLWRITKQCEASLDQYEGVSGGLYRKVYITVRLREGAEPERVLIYVMNEDGIMPPSQQYLNVIEQGYRDFGLEDHFHLLDKALRHSYAAKEKTPYLRKRYIRKGRPPLAQLSLAG